MKRLIFTLFSIAFVWSLAAQEATAPQNQQSLVTKHTATWCPICGYEDSWGTQKYFMDNLDGNGAIVMSAHISSTSKLYSQTAKELLTTYQGVVYQPEFFYNTTKINSNIQTSITNMVNNAAQQSPVAQTGLVVTYNPGDDTLKVRTHTKFFQSTEGEYQLSILLLEREVYETQASRSSNELHRNIIRKSLQTNTFGPIIASGNIAAGTEIKREIAVKWNNQYDLNNIKIVAILWKRNANRYDFVNTNGTTTVLEEQTTNTRTEDVLGSRFAVHPNLTNANALIQLDLPNTFEGTEITLFDRYGRQMRTLYRGNLPAGVQSLPLERFSEPAGMYFLRFRSGATVATRRVVFY